jgi:hypothetical protein
MNNILKQHARTLRLSGLLQSLELRLQEAEANRLPYAQFLELFFQDEINVRHQRLINRRHKLPDYREVRSLDNFDYYCYGAHFYFSACYSQEYAARLISLGPIGCTHFLTL